MQNSVQASISIEKVNIRPIEEKDNAPLAAVIRQTMEEFGANKPGTVYFDATTDALYQVFSQTPRSVYYVAEYENRVMGGCGIFPSPGLPPDTCELVKMYLHSHVRGIGLGSHLIRKALSFASEAGYSKIYLETLPEFQQALRTYERFGFHYLGGPMGNTGHFGCDKWMMRDVNGPQSTVHGPQTSH
jgi:putative acetyltransferase